jgi:glycosyltransferase involved in cell wall biosynthesis
MKLAVLCEYGTIHGGEQSLLAALEHCPADVRVTVLAPAQGLLARALAGRGIAHLPFSVQGTGGVRLPARETLDRLQRALEPVQPDLLHANSLAMGRLTGSLRRATGLCCTAHLRDIIGLSRASVEQLNGNVRLAAVSRATREFHLKQGIEAHRCDVLYNGVDCAQFRPAAGSGPPGNTDSAEGDEHSGDPGAARRQGVWTPEGSPFRKSLGLDAEALLVATVGQIGPRKGLDLLVDAAALVLESMPHVHFVIVGERSSQKEESVEFEHRLHRRTGELRPLGQVHWLGYCSDVAALLREVDLVVHPARQEPFGRVLLESAAAGRPIVACDVGGTRELLIDGQSACLVSPGSAALLAEAMLLLLNDPQRRTQLGARARETVLARFAIAPRAAELFAFWRRAAAEDPRGRSPVATELGPA